MADMCIRNHEVRHVRIAYAGHAQSRCHAYYLKLIRPSGPINRQMLSDRSRRP